jgi:hypothetical protein
MILKVRKLFSLRIAAKLLNRSCSRNVMYDRRVFETGMLEAGTLIW